MFDLKRYAILFVLIFLFSATSSVWAVYGGRAPNVTSAQTPNTGTGGLANVKNAASMLCSDLRALVPPLLFLLIIAAGIVYASGQIFGAEMRGRANVWATAMLVGAIICVLIITVAPQALAMMYGDPNADFSC